MSSPTVLSPEAFLPLNKKLLRRDTPRYRRRKKLLSDPLFLIALFVLLSIMTFAVVAPVVSPYSYQKTELAKMNMAPNLSHWFGTDELGRDLLVRVAYGARLSMMIGVLAASLDLILGVSLGSLSAMMGGKVDYLLMRLMDILYSLPHMLVVIIISVALGTGLTSIILSIAFLAWIPMARIIRADVRTIMQKDFLFSAEALGVSRLQILKKHILPNAVGSIIVTATMTIPKAIFLEAFLSFLGLGVEPPLASWGTIAAEAVSFIEYHPYRLFIPAGMMSLTIFSLNLLSDRLQKKLILKV